ncbi:hypothetical protein [Desulfurobacterium sp.]|uniref:hypothetical protein n=1 Tax=Desulfurobacterium sp. TaxID=2004706 RepID=UPI002602025A|nr:hypothetical protein [Desulfurobacterium sp.]
MQKKTNTLSRGKRIILYIAILMGVLLNPILLLIAMVVQSVVNSINKRLVATGSILSTMGILIGFISYGLHWKIGIFVGFAFLFPLGLSVLSYYNWKNTDDRWRKKVFKWIMYSYNPVTFTFALISPILKVVKPDSFETYVLFAVTFIFSLIFLTGIIVSSFSLLVLIYREIKNKE